MKPQPHILVVEDDTELCNSIIRALQQNDYMPFWATQVREAMFKLVNETYALVILDMRLGEETGEELIEFIRTRRESMNMVTPILVISGYLDQELVKKIRGNVQGAIVKPFDLKTLLDTVQKMVPL